MVGRTYGVYLPETTEALLDIEIRRRATFQPDSRANSIPKLIVACVQKAILDNKLKSVDLVGGI